MSTNLKINHCIIACKVSGVPNIENIQLGGKEQKKLTVPVTFFHSDNETSTSEMLIVVWNKSADMVQQCSKDQIIFCAGSIKIIDKRSAVLLVKSITI